MASKLHGEKGTMRSPNASKKRDGLTKAVEKVSHKKVKDSLDALFGKSQKYWNFKQMRYGE